MGFVFLVFMILGISLVIDGLYTKDAKIVNNGIILILIMLLAFIYSITSI